MNEMQTWIELGPSPGHPDMKVSIMNSYRNPPKQRSKCNNETWENSKLWYDIKVWSTQNFKYANASMVTRAQDFLLLSHGWVGGDAWPLNATMGLPGGNVSTAPVIRVISQMRDIGNVGTLIVEWPKNGWWVKLCPYDRIALLECMFRRRNPGFHISYVFFALDKPEDHPSTSHYPMQAQA
jgi:hypothetical protein